jgi:hypothetical protein
MISQDIKSPPLIMSIQYYGCNDCDSGVVWGSKRNGPVWMCSRYNLTHILANPYRYLAVVWLPIPIANCSSYEASSLPRDSVVPTLGSPRGNGRLNMVSICGTTLSFACSSADAHHTQPPITSCAAEQRLYFLLVLPQMLTIINLPLLLSQRCIISINRFFLPQMLTILSPITSCAERNNSILHMFFRRCSPYSIPRYILRRRAIEDYTK